MNDAAYHAMLRRLGVDPAAPIPAPAGTTADPLGTRVAAFRRQLAAWRVEGRSGWPLFALPGALRPSAGRGACVSCGTALAPATPGEVVARVRCSACVEAVRLAIEGAPREDKGDV